MSGGPTNDAARLTRDDLRRFEARMDARLQEVNARLVMHDGRFAALADRLSQTSRRADVLSDRVDSRLRSIDRRFAALDTRLDATDTRSGKARDQLIDALRDHNSAVARRTFAVLGLMFAITAAAGILTVVLVL